MTHIRYSTRRAGKWARLLKAMADHWRQGKSTVMYHKNVRPIRRPLK